MREGKHMPLTAHKKAIARARAKIEARFRAFFEAYKPSEPYCYGPHTDAIMSELEAATRAVERGENRYTIVNCPPRHGKSDLASRRYGPWHLLRNPAANIILATYAQDLANDMSRSARACSRRILQLSEESQNVKAWQTAQGGTFFATGLRGAVTGRGAEVLIVDDFLKGAEEAQSAQIREKVWDSFRSQLWTRLSPEGHAVVVVANRWHEDDLVGRILREGRDNPDFPSFRHLKYPAREPDSGEWLFTERFSPEQYREFRAAVGQHWWQAMYQQSPKPRRGRLIKVGNVHYHNNVPEDIAWVRAWDVAGTEKERTGHHPHWTVGTKMGLERREDDNQPHLWIADVRRCREEAPERDRIIQRTAEQDGSEVVVAIEGGGRQKDLPKHMQEVLSGVTSVKEVPVSKDKIVRATPLEPFFESGRVHVLRAEWNGPWVSELKAFPGGQYDDQVDSLSLGFKVLKDRPEPGRTRYESVQQTRDYGGLL